jgi:hypothetical protein
MTSCLQHVHATLQRIARMPILSAVLGLLASSSIYAEGTKTAAAGVNLVGQFPTLSKTLEAPENLAKNASPCDLVKPLRTAELEGNWKSIVSSVDLKCEIGEGIENEPSANTNATAKLKPKAANFGGVAIIEIRMSDSAWGNDYQYVLDARFAKVKTQLKATIRKNCIKERGITTPLTDDVCPIENHGQYGGLYLDTGEGGGIWLHPDPDNPNRTIYASAWSE